MHHLGRFRGNVETAYSAMQDHLEPVGPSNRSLLSRFGGGERLLGQEAHGVGPALAEAGLGRGLSSSLILTLVSTASPWGDCGVVSDEPPRVYWRPFHLSHQFPAPMELCFPITS